ncbi:LOW QUALITY PROTEIN: hypothetical protein Cgig2_020739 [Carnegiea gigantea]|uniref:Uncharacterized protein n=1 Tax=Carnegiea gigantea TaxID=171969 RepID=A0A9Q1Q8C8_9CARY|nr:LOW QUALITY PROTEIN: hypothetical protein Cgig2_020739 [Carnegiea gigantea]
MDKTTSARHYLHMQPSESGIDGEETKLPIYNSITCLCKFDGVRGHPSLPWWSKKNLNTRETFLLSGHIKSPVTNHRLGYHCMGIFLTSRFIGSGLEISSFVAKINSQPFICLMRCMRHSSFMISAQTSSEQKPDSSSRNIVLYHRRRSPWVVLDELGVAKGQPTETLLIAFLSCLLCTFILPVRGASCICLGTFSVASFMTSGVGYCIPSAILVSIYNGLNEISHSSHPGRGGAKNFDTYELAGDLVQAHLAALVKPSHSSSQRLENSLVLGGAFIVIHPSSTDSRRLFWMTSSYQELTLFILSIFDVLADLDLDNLPDRKQCFIITTCLHAIEQGLKQLGSKPKLKIVHSGKPLEPFVIAIEDGSSRVKIPGIDVAIPATPIPAIPIQSIAPLPQDELPIRICKPSTEKVIELPPRSAENIIDILSAEPKPTKCMIEIGWLKGVCSPNDDEVKSIRRANAPLLAHCPHPPLKAPRGGISILNANAVTKEVDKNVAQAIFIVFMPPSFNEVSTSLLWSLESKVEDLIKQAYGFKHLQQSYSGRPSVEEQDHCRLEVQGKLDAASRRLNTEGAHYKAKVAELKQLESSEYLLQETEREVIDLQGHIDVLNAIEVMDTATKASLEKTKAYIKEPFEDLKNF